jgi:hypothetical protein
MMATSITRPSSLIGDTAYGRWLGRFKSVDEFLHWLDQCEARDRVVERKARSRGYRRARWFLYRLGRYA